MKKSIVVVAIVLFTTALASAFADMPTAAQCQKARKNCPSHPGNAKCAKVLPKCDQMKM